MNIILITPPSGFLLDERVFPSLGILKVGASLINAGHEVSHWDLSGVKHCEENVRVRCNLQRGAGTPIFAMTATTPQMPAAVKITKTIREILPEAKIILGGPHATLVNAASKGEHLRGKLGRGNSSLRRLLNIYDVVVTGDGENAIHQALIIASEGGGHTKVDADDPKSEHWLTSQKFTESPWPMRRLIDVDSYHYEIEGERAMHVVAQLGCPFACGFCGGRESYMLRRIRLRSTENVIAEMEMLHQKYGVKAMMLNDDELNVNTQMIPLMQAIADLGKRYSFQWKLRGFVKAELFNDEQAEAMYAAGFRWLLCGFESANPRILNNINKKATREDNTRMLHIAHRHGLKVKALMSAGHPGESIDTILDTRDWLLEQKPDDFDLTVITKYPGTPYWDHALPIGGGTYCYTFNEDRLYSEDVDFLQDAAYYKGRPGDYKSFVWTDYLSAEKLCELRDEIEHEVRGKLGISYPTKTNESSMGQRSNKNDIR